MSVKQPRAGAIENGDLSQMEVETVRRYVSALGGELRPVVGFGDHDEIMSTTTLDRNELAIS